ncbi:MAG: helix-turn-helix transcriptional regulator [Nitrospira sp.]|nr:helix-turn-helix transcriptional regulator [Nitrospira sp.]
MEHLRAIRTQQGLSLRTLAEKSGVHFVSLAKMEAGRLDPRLSSVQRVAMALGVSVSELIGEQPITKGGKSHGTHQTKGRVVRGVSRRG